MPTRDQIATAITLARSEYIVNGESPSYFKINDGLCDCFAADVAKSFGGETDQFYAVGNGNFSKDGDDFSGDWDWALLKTHWGIKPPSGLTKKQVSDIQFGAHIWLTDGGFHYDAECPAGVEDFFELPIFQRYIVQELRERGIPCDDVITDDIVEHPGCPVPNPVAAQMRQR